MSPRSPVWLLLRGICPLNRVRALGLWLAGAMLLLDTARAATITNGFLPLNLTPASGAAPASPRALRSLPRGPWQVRGVPFQVGAPLFVAGQSAARRFDVYPPQVAGLTCGVPVRRLHLLLATLRTDKDGVPLANIVFHYADGATEKVRLGYGVHARSWIVARGEKQSALLDPGSQLAWTDPTGEAGAGPRLFHAVLENPRPGQTVASLDVESLFSQATPWIAAATAETPEGNYAAPRTGAPRKVVRNLHARPDAAYRAEFLMHVTNGVTGQPATNATVSLTIADDSRNVFLGEVKTDAQGLARVPYPPQETFGFSLWVHAPGFAPTFVSESKASVRQFKGEYAVTLQPGRSIGGVVQSVSGQPVAGAQVAVYRLIKNGSRTFNRVDHDLVITDEKGKWQTASAPPSLETLFFQVSHAEFRPALFGTTYFEPVATTTTSTTSSSTRRVIEDAEAPSTVRRISVINRAPRDLLIDTNALAAQTAVFSLQPALLIEGTVARADKSLLPGVEVFVQPPNGDRFSVRTDAQGRFVARVPEPGPVELFIVHEGLAPLHQTVSVGPQLAPLNLTLPAPRVVNGRVQDQKQRPIAGARVRLEDWFNAADLLRFEAVTDETGAFRWTNAPAGGVMFLTSKTNFSNSRHSFGGTMQDITITLTRPPGVYGRVVDAATGKPVESFTLVPGRKYSANETRIRWDRSEMVRGTDGEYSLKLSSYYFQPEARVLIEAPGYAPQISRAFTGQDAHTNDFVLQPARGIAGVVLAPDGSPAAGAALVLVEKSESAYLDPASQVRANGGGSDVLRSDAQGRFEFVPRLEPDRIYVSHESGFAEARAADVAKGGKITLQKWGRLQGVVRVGTPGETDAAVRVASDAPPVFDEDGNSAGFSFTLKADPDGEGKFSFDRIPPGEHRVALEYRFKDDRYGEAALSHGFLTNIQAGATANVILGGTGRRITGRVNLAGGDHGDVDWRRDVHRLTLIVPPPPGAPGNARAQAVPDGNAISILNNIISFRNVPAPAPDAAAMRDWQRRERSYVLVFETNGTFRADHVPPGNYQLSLNVTDPDDEYYNRRSIGATNVPVTIPDERAAAVNAPFDLGAIELAIRPRLRVGRTVPAIQGKGADGKVFSVASFKGKPVLLYFWGQSIGYSSSEFQALKELQRTHGESGELVIIGCNLDGPGYNPEQFARSQGFTWKQMYLGSWEATPVPGLFGLNGNSGAVLIDAEGKLASGTIRGSNLRTAVLAALEE